MTFLQEIHRLRQQSKNDKSFDDQNGHYRLLKKLYNQNGFDLIMTSCACPEQYEVFKDDVQVAYYRLRHGEFRIDVPDCGGTTIYETEPEGDGIFSSNERLNQMANAMRVLLKHNKNNN
jgi:hypothetical protein